jgi:hypothetical protein
MLLSECNHTSEKHIMNVMVSVSQKFRFTVPVNLGNHKEGNSLCIDIIYIKQENGCSLFEAGIVKSVVTERVITFNAFSNAIYESLNMGSFTSLSETERNVIHDYIWGIIYQFVIDNSIFDKE